MVNPYASKMYNVVRNMVNKDWNPIGISGHIESIDDYDPYIGAICDAVVKNGNKKEIFNILWSIETGALGLRGNRENTERFSEQLIQMSKNNTF